MSSPEVDDGPEGTGTPEGIDVEGVSAWYAANIPATVLPLRFGLIAGGHSNLTFAVTDAGGTRTVLRRPPTGHVLPTAHDMRREHTILSAVGPAGVPVPRTLGLCEDPSVNGAPFYVMEFTDGIVARNEEEVEALLTPEARFRSGEALVDTLAQIHAVDPDAVGLGDLGRKEDYIPRQLRRWYGQYRTSRDEKGGPDVADVDVVHDLLAARVPEQKGASIVHGDFRLDNCMLDPAGRVLAVLDWELCTLGDPLADVGLLLTYWSEPGERSPLEHSPTRAPGFPTRKDLAVRYQEASGRDLSQVDFYRAFSSWRIACILEGVYTRYIGGAMGDQDIGVVQQYPSTIAWLAGQAKEILAASR